MPVFIHVELSWPPKRADYLGDAFILGAPHVGARLREAFDAIKIEDELAFSVPARVLEEFDNPYAPKLRFLVAYDMVQQVRLRDTGHLLYLARVPMLFPGEDRLAANAPLMPFVRPEARGFNVGAEAHWVNSVLRPENSFASTYTLAGLTSRVRAHRMILERFGKQIPQDVMDDYDIDQDGRLVAKPLQSYEKLNASLLRRLIERSEINPESPEDFILRKHPDDNEVNRIIRNALQDEINRFLGGVHLESTDCEPHHENWLHVAPKVDTFSMIQ